MGALEGVRVLDLGLLVQGPQAASLLGEMGADVIKVELPGFGEQARWVVLGDQDRRAPYFAALNRGKRSITIDLRTDPGREVFLRLAETADVVVSNFKVGTLDDWGLGYDAVAARNPRIVYGCGSLFGPLGPDAHREGADLVGQAAGGLISTIGAAGGEPSPVGVTIADHIASQNLVAGVLAALFARERTGRGQRVDSSLLGGQIYAQAGEYAAFGLTGTQARPADHGHPLIQAVYFVVPTADGHLALVGVPTGLRSAFYDAIERPDLAEDPRFKAMVLRPEDKSALRAILATEVFPKRTTAEWCAILTGAKQRFAPVRTYADVAADAGVWANGYLHRWEHPDWGGVTMPAAPVGMSDTPLRPGGALPELGQHTEELLEEIGYSWDEITALRESGAV